MIGDIEPGSEWLENAFMNPANATPLFDGVFGV